MEAAVVVEIHEPEDRLVNLLEAPEVAHLQDFQFQDRVEGLDVGVPIR